MSGTTFDVIRPLTITAAMLTSSNVAEPAVTTNPDPAAWVSGAAYNVGDQVHRTTTHKIYQARTNHTGIATLPENDTTNWLEVSATNKWKMFDLSRESQTTRADSLVVVLTPGVFVDTLALLNLQGASVRVQVASTSYDQTVQLQTRAVLDWWDYFFEPFTQKEDVVFTDLPMLTSNVITITITNSGATAACGACVLGQSAALGKTEYGASAGITDYSIKSTDQFGQTTVVERKFSKRMSVPLWVEADRVDANQRLLASYRATPLVFVAAGNLYEALIVYGFYKSFDQVIPGPRYAKMALDIEGLA